MLESREVAAFDSAITRKSITASASPPTSSINSRASRFLRASEALSRLLGFFIKSVPMVIAPA
jgi:hypothetical protein